MHRTIPVAIDLRALVRARRVPAALLLFVAAGAAAAEPPPDDEGTAGANGAVRLRSTPRPAPPAAEPRSEPAPAAAPASEPAPEPTSSEPAPGPIEPPAASTVDADGAGASVPLDPSAQDDVPSADAAGSADAPAPVIRPLRTPAREAMPIRVAGLDAASPGAATTDDEPATAAVTAASTADPLALSPWRIAAGLGLLAALIVAARVAFNRSGQLAGSARRPSGMIEVLGRFPIARGQHLMLLKIARRVILVHEGGGTMQTLSTIDDHDQVAMLISRTEAARSGPRGDRFTAMLDRVAGGGGEDRERATERPAARHSAPSIDVQGEVVDLTRRTRGGARPAVTRAAGRGARA